jgi:hypothetical protein
MNTCSQSDELLRFLNDELADDKRAEIEAHVEDCETCQRVLRDMIQPPIPTEPTALKAPAEPSAPVRGGGAPARQAGLNLLFGILALQNNFVSREELLTAFAAWLADKTQSLLTNAKTAAP